MQERARLPNKNNELTPTLEPVTVTHTPHPRKSGHAYEWYVVSLCMVAYIFSFVDRQILSLMIEPIKADLQISDTQFSLLSGLAFSLFYAFMGVPIAYLSDRASRVRIIAIGVAFWSLATAVCGLSKNFLQMFLARMGVGVGEAALTPATYSMLSDMFPREKLGRAIGLYSMGAFLGGGLAFLVGGYVIELLRRRAQGPVRPERNRRGGTAMKMVAIGGTGLIGTQVCTFLREQGHEVLAGSPKTGGADPVHRHDAHGFIYVLEGAIVMGMKGGEEVTPTPGQSFHEGPQDIHTVGRNASREKPAKFLVFLLKDEGKPPVIPVD
ncbi:putative sialic acid transporter [compost metagenome]